ncbi:hypothetical protein OF830_25315 [Bacillus paramycoides]|uniref:hypothetical protein n=1 Tax=Bacillus paramycoides TaxID=2026194 RepID=UPI0022440B15|nr:hypothetical protein [Bacillus paramycoides]MCW9134118.1 hypothetical protein [Bacillus paramycoides]
MIRKIFIGSALALATSALLPAVRNTLRPLVATGIKGAKSTFETIKEEVEDIIVEAKLERMQKQFDKELSHVEQESTYEQEVSSAQEIIKEQEVTSEEKNTHVQEFENKEEVKSES